MALENPMYIDQVARHTARQVRLLDYVAVEGMEGALAPGHLEVRALGVPGNEIQMLPGAYSILARHLGGEYEAYLGKVSVAEQSDEISPTNSSGPRTDLVILQVQNPYVVGSGTWPAPGDPLEGPYVRLRVIEGVSAAINHVSAYNNTWSAITLARITRPINTNVVTQGHITDLRSLARIGGQRVVVVNNPSVTPPPIAQQEWTESTPCSSGDELLSTQSTWKDFPAQAQWDVPIPSWAVGVDIQAFVTPAVIGGNVYGEMRLVLGADNATSVPGIFDENLTGAQIRPVFMIGGTEFLDPGVRGKVARVKLQARSLDTGNSGKLKASRGTRVNISLNFKRFPVTNDPN